MVRRATLLLLVPLLIGTTSAQQPTFRAETELVTFGVTVTDRRGNFVTDLAADDFLVVEEGKPQSIKYFTQGEGGAAPELHVGLLFDTSGSMGEDIQLARTAAIKFLNTLTDAEDITLVDFDTEVRVSRYGQQDFPRLVERIRTRKPDGYTAMHDALAMYLQGAEGLDGRKILVLFSDGGDTRSTLSFADAMTLVRASDVTVYSIGLIENQPQSVKNQQRLRLTQLATESGGEAFFPLSMKHVDAAYEKILAQIRAQYSLGYISTTTRNDGGWRRVDIRVRPDLKDLRVQARKGYFAPYQP
jgi:Ca-activated chloride channel homolog